MKPPNGESEVMKIATEYAELTKEAAIVHASIAPLPWLKLPIVTALMRERLDYLRSQLAQYQ